MAVITLYKITNSTVGDRYIISPTPVANGEVLASYNNIAELYPVILSQDATFQTQLATAAYHTVSARESMGAKNSIHQTGTGNSQFGTQWIYSDSEKRSKKIRVTDDIPDGWNKGRKIKFEE